MHFGAKLIVVINIKDNLEFRKTPIVIQFIFIRRKIFAAVFQNQFLKQLYLQEKKLSKSKVILL